MAGCIAWREAKEESKRFFCEDKEAKKHFINLGPCWFQRYGPSPNKSFCAAFFKKRSLPFPGTRWL